MHMKYCIMCSNWFDTRVIKQFWPVGNCAVCVRCIEGGRRDADYFLRGYKAALGQHADKAHDG